MTLTGTWTLEANRTLLATPDPDDSRGYIPIPPQYIPATPGQQDIQTTHIAIASSSTAARFNWSLGFMARIESRSPQLSTPIATDRYAVLVNRAARIIEVPNWAQSGFQIVVDIPYWYTVMQLEVFTYDGP